MKKIMFTPVIRPRSRSRRLQLPHEIAEHRAHRVRGAGDGEAQE
jgi:hypothetical protein